MFRNIGFGQKCAMLYSEINCSCLSANMSSKILALIRPTTFMII